MLSKDLLASAAVALCATSINAQATTTDEPLVDASDIEEVVPTQLLSPAEATSLAAVADSFIASVTAAPEFSSVVSVLSTGIPVTAQEAIEADPSDFLLNLINGSPPPSWATALPPSVGQYIESVASNAANIFTSDFPELYASATSEVAALETSAAASGGFTFPSGGYGGSNFTGSRATGSAAAPGLSPITDSDIDPGLLGLSTPIRQPPTQPVTPPDQITQDLVVPPGAPGATETVNQGDDSNGDHIDKENEDFYGTTVASNQPAVPPASVQAAQAPVPNAPVAPYASQVPAPQPASSTRGTSSRKRRELEDEQPKDPRSPKRQVTDDRWQAGASASDGASTSETPQAPAQDPQPLFARQINRPIPRLARPAHRAPFAPALVGAEQLFGLQPEEQSREPQLRETELPPADHPQQRRRRTDDIAFRSRYDIRDQQLSPYEHVTRAQQAPEWDQRAGIPGFRPRSMWRDTAAEEEPVSQTPPQDGAAFNDDTLFLQNTESQVLGNQDAAEALVARLAREHALEEAANAAREQNWDPESLEREIEEENHSFYDAGDRAFMQQLTPPSSSFPQTQTQMDPPTTRGTKRDFAGRAVPNPSAPNATTTAQPPVLISPTSPRESRSSSLAGDQQVRTFSRESSPGEAIYEERTREFERQQYQAQGQTAEGEVGGLLPSMMRRGTPSTWSTASDDNGGYENYAANDNDEREDDVYIWGDDRSSDNGRVSLGDDDDYAYWEEQDDLRNARQDMLDEEEADGDSRGIGRFDGADEDESGDHNLSNAGENPHDDTANKPDGEENDGNTAEQFEDPYALTGDPEVDMGIRVRREHDIECHDLMVAANEECQRPMCPWCPGLDGKGGWLMR
ncbi:MAG: hypothetical protein Q9218_005296 [Villophora microphyllina]